MRTVKQRVFVCIYICVIIILLKSVQKIIDLLNAINIASSSQNTRDDEQTIARYKNRGEISQYFDESIIIGYPTTSSGTTVIEGNKCSDKFFQCTIGEVGLSDVCNQCVETNARCIHYDSPVRIRDFYTGEFIGDPYPANTNSNLGYCTPFESRTRNNEQELKSCNSNTGKRYLAKMSKYSSGYMMVCVCNDDLFFTQKIPLTSDCIVPQACERTGGTTTGFDFRTNDFEIEKLRCENCPLGTHFKRDPITKIPRCVPKKFTELTVNEADVLLPPTPANIRKLIVGQSDFIRSDIRDKFVHKDRTLYDPCSYDPITGEIFTEIQCNLYRSSSGINYCASADLSIIAVIQSDTILAQNDSLYPNACMRVWNNDKDRPPPVEIVEFWNAPKSDSKLSAPKTGSMVKFNMEPGFPVDSKFNNSYALAFIVNSLINNSKKIFVARERKNFNVMRLVDRYSARMLERYEKSVGLGGRGGGGGGGSSPSSENFHIIRESDYELRRIPFSDKKPIQIFIVFYNARYPNDHVASSFIKSTPRYELGEGKLPGIAESVGTLLLPTPRVYDNRIIDLLPCENIGRLSSAFSLSGYYSFDLKYTNIDFTNFQDRLFNSFVSCVPPQSMASSFPIVPNAFIENPMSKEQYLPYMYLTCVLAIDHSGTVYSIWLGDFSDISKYIGRLPSTPQVNLY